MHFHSCIPMRLLTCTSAELQVTTRAIADSFAATGVEYFNTFGGNPVAGG